LSPEQSDVIEQWCNSAQIKVIGRIPYDELVIESIRKGIPITNIHNSHAAKEIHKLHYNLMKELEAIKNDK